MTAEINSTRNVTRPVGTKLDSVGMSTICFSLLRSNCIYQAVYKMH